MSEYAEGENSSHWLGEDTQKAWEAKEDLAQELLRAALPSLVLFYHKHAIVTSSTSGYTDRKDSEFRRYHLDQV